MGMQLVTGVDKGKETNTKAGVADDQTLFQNGHILVVVIDPKEAEYQIASPLHVPSQGGVLLRARKGFDCVRPGLKVFRIRAVSRLIDYRNISRRRPPAKVRNAVVGALVGHRETAGTLAWGATEPLKPHRARCMQWLTVRRRPCRRRAGPCRHSTLARTARYRWWSAMGAFGCDRPEVGAKSSKPFCQSSWGTW